MTDKEKIRNELMLRLTNYKETLNVSHNSVLNLSLKSKIDQMESLLSFIDSLPEEHVSDGFEEALSIERKAYNDRGAATVDALEDNTQELAFAKGFYYGAKWQKEQMMEHSESAEIGYWNQRGLSIML